MFLFGQNSSAFFKPAPGWFDFGSRDTSSRWHVKPNDWRGSGEWKMQSRSCHVNIYVVIVVLILIDNRVFGKTFHTDSAHLNLLDPDAQARLISKTYVGSSQAGMG